MFNSDQKSIFTCKIWRGKASLSEASLEKKGYRDWCLEFLKTTKKRTDSDKYEIWGQLTLLLSVSLSHMLGSRFSDFLHISSPFTKRACFISVCVSIMFSKVPTWIEANKTRGSNFNHW